jgi:ubiquinone/menaquinone biosynthesis C-methylase UbiE
VNDSAATRHDDSASSPERYIHGYDTEFTLKQHAGRTAEVHARWFLPYLRPDMTLLDCGCGSGSITVGLAAAVAPGHVVGVDIAEVEIERARERAAGAGAANVRFVTGTLYALDLPGGSFDAVFSHNVLEHLRTPQRALGEMRRVLKPGGVIGIRDIDAGGHLLAPNDPLLHRWLELHEADWAGLGGHPRLGRRLRGLLEEAGFNVVQASASYDLFADEEGRRLACQLAVSRIREPAYVERLLAKGLADREHLAAIAAVWSAWPERTDAFLALAHGEAVGHNPL